MESIFNNTDFWVALSAVIAAAAANSCLSKPSKNKKNVHKERSRHHD